VHDGSLAELAHVRLHGLAQPQGRPQVDVHQHRQVRRGHGDRLAQAERADGIHQDLRRAGVGGDPVDQAPGGSRIGGVAHLTADAVGQFLQPLLVAVDPGDAVADAGQVLRGSPADLSARADHDRYASAHLVSPSGYG